MSAFVGRHGAIKPASRVLILNMPSHRAADAGMRVRPTKKSRNRPGSRSMREAQPHGRGWTALTGTPPRRRDTRRGSLIAPLLSMIEGRPDNAPISGGFLLAVGARWLYAQHDLCRCFDLCWSSSLLRGNHGMAPARLDSKALLAQKPERSALHRRRCGTAFERRHWSSGRLANRGGAWPHGIVVH